MVARLRLLLIEQQMGVNDVFSIFSAIDTDHNGTIDFLEVPPCHRIAADLPPQRRCLAAASPPPCRRSAADLPPHRRRPATASLPPCHRSC